MHGNVLHLLGGVFQDIILMGSIRASIAIERLKDYDTVHHIGAPLLLISHHSRKGKTRGKLEAHNLLEKESDLFLHFLLSMGFLGTEVLQIILKLAYLFSKLNIFCMIFVINYALVSFVK